MPYHLFVDVPWSGMNCFTPRGALAMCANNGSKDRNFRGNNHVSWGNHVLKDQNGRYI